MTDDNGQHMLADGEVYEVKEPNNGIAEIFSTDSETLKYAKRVFNSLKSKDSISMTVENGVASFIIE